MSEVLWDTVVKAIENLDKKANDLQNQVNGLPDHSEFLTKIDSRLGAAEAEITALPEKIFMPFPVIVALTKALRTHSQLLSLPIKQKVRHEHHLTKPVWACFGMLLVIIGLLFLLYYKWFEADLRKENDLKYRYLQVFQLPEGKKILHQLDSLYSANPDEFRKTVILREKIELDSFEDFKRMQEKQQQIKELQEKWNQQPRKKSD
jgi:hypothetical protein